jgi:hypothetical protein
MQAVAGEAHYISGVGRNIAKLMTEKAARLGRETFGVDCAHGPWQQRLAEIEGITPIAFGQFGEIDGARPRSTPR